GKLPLLWYNRQMLRCCIKFLYEVEKLLFKWLNRRSQRKSFDWEKFRLFLKKFPLPTPRIFVNIYDVRVRIFA
ncbi:hypothetical protein, partial [Syntrophaceticus schinkii]